MHESGSNQALTAPALTASSEVTNVSRARRRGRRNGRTTLPALLRPGREQHGRRREREEEAPPAPRLAIESEASALLAKLIGDTAEAKTRPERETARLACAAAGSLAQIPGAAGAFEGGLARDVLAEGPSATLCVARGARFRALDELNDAPAPPPVDAGATWACLVGRPWPAAPGARPAPPFLPCAAASSSARRRRARRAANRTPAGVVGALPLRRRAGRCGVDTGAARVHARRHFHVGHADAPVAHLVAACARSR